LDPLKKKRRLTYDLCHSFEFVSKDLTFGSDRSSTDFVAVRAGCSDSAFDFGLRPVRADSADFVEFPPVALVPIVQACWYYSYRYGHLHQAFHNIHYVHNGHCHYGGVGGRAIDTYHHDRDHVTGRDYFVLRDRGALHDYLMSRGDGLIPCGSELHCYETVDGMAMAIVTNFEYYFQIYSLKLP